MIYTNLKKEGYMGFVDIPSDMLHNESCIYMTYIVFLHHTSFKIGIILFLGIHVPKNQIVRRRESVLLRFQKCKNSLYMSHRIGKLTICRGENKGADQLRSNCEADQRPFVFAPRILQFLFFLNPKFPASNHLL